MAEYRSTGKSEKLLQYIDSNWRLNNTVIDYDYANIKREQGDDGLAVFEFQPLKVAELMGVDTTEKAGTSSIERLAEKFQTFSFSTLTLGVKKRLVIEVIVGEMADIMERIRYNLLDHRLSAPSDSKLLDPTLFPRTFDYVHMSNIP